MRSLLALSLQMSCVCAEYNLFNREWLPEATDLNQALGRSNSAVVLIGLQKPVWFFLLFPLSWLCKSSENP